MLPGPGKSHFGPLALFSIESVLMASPKQTSVYDPLFIYYFVDQFPPFLVTTFFLGMLDHPFRI